MFNTIIFSCPSNSEESVPEFSNRIIQNVDFPVFIHQPVKRSQSYNYFNYQVKANLDRDKRRASVLVDELLMDIYNPHSSNNNNTTTDDYSGSGKSHKSCIIETDVNWHREKDKKELIKILNKLHEYIEHTGSVLVRQLKRRDALWRQQESVCSVITKVLLQHSYGASSEGINMRFTIQPNPGESGFDQWVAAMKMVAQLPGGIPSEFRRRLWITMAEKHLASRGIEWSQVEKTCFSEWSHPTDAELGIQIVKDLHRTGCSLFCGENGQENQALLKKVLLAYARWNKAVGYCQGFNMLAALILQVTDCSESDTLKLMIYLIEGVLPDSYFADSLRGLSVDMAVFRELLRSKLPRLSKHLDLLQNSSKDGCKSYEPPLTNVFTMQWFLTLFCNCLPQPTVLRVWDLIFLEGNEILLRTALAIWQVLAQRILALKTADEFYCAMGSLTNELLESNLIDANTLIKAIVNVGALAELKNLRDHYLYNITPWGSSAIPRAPEKRIIKQSIPLDISSLKKQYVKLKQRQRQAHVIFSSAISRQPPPVASTTTTPPSIAINHLLIGKKSLGTNKRTGPAKGTIPPPRQIHPSTIHWKNAEKKCSSSSSSDTELCDEDDVQSSVSSEDEKSVPENSDVNKDTLMPPSIADLKLTSDSEDESCSVDFENFLADRVKCFKENNHTNNNEVNLEDESQINDDYTIRRNSAMALQIIQENSLILHKIMQCQSRLSPSPPPPLLLFNPADDESEKVNSNTRMDNVNSWIENNEIELFNNDDDKISVDLSSEKIESRFHHILEKSKSLDERYNNLFRLSSSTIHESKSDTPVGSGTTIILESSASSNRDDDNDENALKENPNSSKLIQENLDLLKAFSANKAKKQREKLIEENVHLLKSISLEKCCTNNKSVTEENDGEILQINVEVDEHTEGENLKFEEIQNNSPTLLSNPLIIFDEDNNKSMENIPNICCDNESAISSDNGQSLTIINKKFFSVMEENSSETDDRSSSSPSIPKSPSRTFNPFPISHNSRQSKEVPLKLGLYKK